jgi:hypothetical protein
LIDTYQMDNLRQPDFEKFPILSKVLSASSQGINYPRSVKKKSSQSNRYRHEWWRE